MTAIATDVLVVGAGPAGSAAAAWCARHGLDTLLVDSANFPRDKPCGDGLTPRAVAELRELGMQSQLAAWPENWGLRAGGFGRTWHLPWPGGSLPETGSAVARNELDNAIFEVAKASGARTLEGTKVLSPIAGTGNQVTRLLAKQGGTEVEISCQRLIVADGARSTLGRVLGRTWFRNTVYGVAARAYVNSDRSDDPWISSHLELRDEDGDVLSGYGWVFPLGDGKVNLGVGTLATEKRPADVNLRKLLQRYHKLRTDDWELTGRPQMVKSALLPMGGAVTGVAGPNWLLIGDAAGCVNPLNGEGIDYGLETGRLAADLLVESPLADLTNIWPDILTQRYGGAFSAARRLAGPLTDPALLRKAGPVGMRSRSLMGVALRIMGNLVTDEDTDTLARVWRTLGRGSQRLDERPPFAA